MNELISLIENLKADGKIDSLDEATTKQTVVLRLLSLLGWDLFNANEIKPEYSVGEGRVDFSLRIDNTNKVFVEVKKSGEELENHQEQLLSYSFREGIKLSVLTSGVTWWFYLPLNEGSWEQRKFYTIDILQQESKDIASKFVDFLSKDNIVSGKAIQNAEATHKLQQKDKVLRDTLPKAWNKLVEEADDLLIELVNDTTEKICGFKAGNQLIEQFLSRHKNNLIIHASQPKGITPPTRSTRLQVSRPALLLGNENYAGKSISFFYFKGSRYEVRSWKDLLIKLCELLNTAHRTEFNKTLTLVGTKRPYFTRNANELRLPEKIDNTDIFVETHLSSNRIYKICSYMLTLFGYSTNDLKIEAS